MNSSHHIDELITCTICGKKARSRGDLKLPMEKCSKDQHKAENDNIESLTVREDQNRRTTVNEPSTFDFQIGDTYEHIINFFPLPKGSIGKQFIQDTMKLLAACNTNSNNKIIALKSLMIFPFLTLRKNCPYSKFFWSVFSRICTEYGETLRISPYSVQRWENADQENSEYEYFSRSVMLHKTKSKSQPFKNK